MIFIDFWFVHVFSPGVKLNRKNHGSASMSNTLALAQARPEHWKQQFLRVACQESQDGEWPCLTIQLSHRPACWLKIQVLSRMHLLTTASSFFFFRSSRGHMMAPSPKWSTASKACWNPSLKNTPPSFSGKIFHPSHSGWSDARKSSPGHVHLHLTLTQPCKKKKKRR